MPLHDWTRVPAGLFHHINQSWSVRIVDALNAGRLPEGVAAFVEQRSGPREPDVLAIEERPPYSKAKLPASGVAVKSPPLTRIVRRTSRDVYAEKANRITVRHHLGRILAIIEIVSPGNKDSRVALADFVAKTVQFLRAGIHVLVLDPFPPTPRDSLGIHKVIWDQIQDEPFALPQGKDRILASYEASEDYAAYVEPIAVGDELPDMPLFLTYDLHAMVPLESTYHSTWEATPQVMRRAVETGMIPDPGAEG